MARFSFPTLVAVLAVCAASAESVLCPVESEQPTPSADTMGDVPVLGTVHAYGTPAAQSTPTTLVPPAATALRSSSPVVTPMATSSSPPPATRATPAPAAATPAPPTASGTPTAFVTTATHASSEPTQTPPPTTPTTASVATSTPDVPYTFTTGGTMGLGTCYEPMHSQQYPFTGGDSSGVGAILDRDLAQLSQRFTMLRTYHAQYFGLRIADYASKFNLQLFVGLAKFPQHPEWEALELEAAVQGARQHPGTVQAIIVGSEDLVQAGGDQTVDAVVAKVQRVRQALAAAGVSGVMVGTAQRINELANPSLASDMARLVAACDFVGVNIYPFFSTGFDARDPVALLDAQWSQLRARFGASMHKMRLTETGWPSAGAAPQGFPGNAPSRATQRAYFQAVASWKPHDMAGPHFWFMAYDRRGDDPSLRGRADDFEQFFGVYTSDNQDKGVL